MSLVYRSTGDDAKWVYALDSDGGQTVETGGGDDRVFVGRLYETGAFPGLENWGPAPNEDEDRRFRGWQ